MNTPLSLSTTTASFLSLDNTSAVLIGRPTELPSPSSDIALGFSWNEDPGRRLAP